MIDFDGLFGGEPVAYDMAPRARQKPKGKRRAAKALPPVRASAALQAAFRAHLERMVDEMGSSVEYWLKAEYRAADPASVAMDESPAAMLRDAINRLAARWIKRFDEGAPRLAKWFATKAKDRSDVALKKILKDAGFSIDWKLTPAMHNAMTATVAEQVGLIKSIPEQYFTQIEGMVMRSATTGRDLATLTKELKKHFGVTQRRASLIARDQNAKLTSTFNRVRQLEAGLEFAVWCHSAGGHHPRPTHVQAGKDREKYSISEGWPDPALGGKKIWPGSEINCRCFSRACLPGWTK